MPARRRQVAAPTDLPHLWPRRLLRRLSQPPRDGAPSRNIAPDHPLDRARRGLELVLRRRGRIRPRHASWHDADSSVAASELTEKPMPESTEIRRDLLGVEWQQGQ